MRKFAVLCAALAVMLVVSVSSPSAADTWIKQVRHTGAYSMMGQSQPEKDETMVTWIGKDRARVDMADGSSVIIFPGKKIMYMINNTDKTYSEMPMDFQKAIGESVEKQAGGDPEAKAMAEKAKQMAGAMMKFDATVTPTGEKKKVGDWNCTKYMINLDMPMGKTTSEAWATEDVKVDPELFWAATNAMFAGNEGFQKMMKEMKKVKGIIVSQESTSEVMGTRIKSTDKIVEISEKAPPAGTYEIPKGYKKSE